MWRRLFDDCKNKQGEEVEQSKKEYTKRLERLGVAKMERSLPVENIPIGNRQ